MEITARIIAKVALFADVRLLNPHGLSLLPIHQGLLERYGFLTYQRSDFDYVKGIRYADGHFVFDGSPVAVAVTIFSTGWLVESSMSTESAEAFFEDVSSWVNSIGFASANNLVTGRSYESHLAFKLDLDISKQFDKLEGVARLIAHLSGDPNEQLTGFYIGKEREQVSTFTFERLLGAPFSENQYFSRAALPTNKHLRALQEIEQILS